MKPFAIKRLLAADLEAGSVVLPSDNLPPLEVAKRFVPLMDRKARNFVEYKLKVPIRKLQEDTAYLSMGSGKVWASYRACRITAALLISTELKVVKDEELAGLPKSPKRPAMAGKYMKAPTDQESDLAEIPELKKLLRFPNPYETWEELLELWTFHIKLTGKAYWLKDGAGKGGKPEALYPLLPQYMEIVPDEKTMIEKFVYRVNGNTIEFKPDQIIYFRRPNPANFILGLGEVEAASALFTRKVAKDDYEEKFLANGAVPSGIMTYKGSDMGAATLSDTAGASGITADQDTWGEFKKRWQEEYGGPRNAGKTAFITGEWDYIRMGLTSQEMQSSEAEQWNIEQIFHVHGVPLSMVGVRNAANYATARQDEINFRRYEIVPLLDLLVGKLNAEGAFVRNFDDQSMLVYDLIGLVDVERAWTDYQGLHYAGGMTLNEIRVKMGLEKAEDPMLDAYLFPNGRVTSTQMQEMVERGDNLAPEEEGVLAMVHAGYPVGPLYQSDTPMSIESKDFKAGFNPGQERDETGRWVDEDGNQPPKRKPKRPPKDSGKLPYEPKQVDKFIKRHPEIEEVLDASGSSAIKKQCLRAGVTQQEHTCLLSYQYGGTKDMQDSLTEGLTSKNSASWHAGMATSTAIDKIERAGMGNTNTTVWRGEINVERTPEAYPVGDVVEFKGITSTSANRASAEEFTNKVLWKLKKDKGVGVDISTYTDSATFEDEVEVTMKVGMRVKVEKHTKGTLETHLYDLEDYELEELGNGRYMLDGIEGTIKDSNDRERGPVFMRPITIVHGTILSPKRKKYVYYKAGFDPSQERDEYGRWVDISGPAPPPERPARKSAMRKGTKKDRERLAEKGVGIPPAYTNLKVAVDPEAERWATAVNDKGKTIRFYDPEYSKSQAAAKYRRVAELHHSMPEIKAQIDSDIKAGGRSMQEAMKVRLIMKTGLRNGGTDGDGEVPTFGASSLLVKHVRVENDTIHLNFIGKKGVQQAHSFTDSDIAQYCKSRKAEGYETLFDRGSSSTLYYLKKTTTKVAGEHYKVHDLRTYYGTSLADAVVHKLNERGEAPTTLKEFAKARKRVGRVVGRALGNGGSTALSSYVHPEVFGEWEEKLAELEK